MWYGRGRLTFFLDLLPSELVSPDNWENRIEAMQRDQLQGLLQMERMETRGSGLDVTHHVHHCKHKVQKIKRLICHPDIYIKQTKNAGQMLLTTVRMLWQC